ncbi:MAG TPA: long-chain fatty acid--CoA ligase, partial [Alphaproteobacteria bacterium]|nr:long-chain fatty acid--CoA ligase [Alphaproteobacteria bacterium]
MVSSPDRPLDTIPRLVAHHAQNSPDAAAFREKEFGIWQSWTWRQTAAEIDALALGFLDIGVNAGDHIAIIGRNRPYLYWAMVAAQSVGAIPVPLYQDAVAEEMAYVLEHCSARFIVAQDQEQVDKIIDVKEELSGVEQIIFLDPRGMRKYERSLLTEYSVLQAQGRENEAKLRPELDKRLAAQSGADTCAMLYTSGTTGRPKGVVLSNDNIIMTSKASCSFDGLRADDSVLAYLPMAWVGDFIFSVGQASWSGFCVACPESSDTMQHDLREIGPTYFFAPPRYFEGVLTSVMIRMEDAGDLKRVMFKHFMEFARTVGPDILD